MSLKDTEMVPLAWLIGAAGAGFTGAVQTTQLMSVGDEDTSLIAGPVDPLFWLNVQLTKRGDDDELEIAPPDPPVIPAALLRTKRVLKIWGLELRLYIPPPDVPEVDAL